jgi:hypothetical protein
LTLNQDSVHRLRKIAGANSTPDDLTKEVTEFLSLSRKSNWLVIDELTTAFNRAAVLFGIQLLLWIAGAAVLYHHLHGAAATPHM